MLCITFLLLVASVAGHGWPNRTYTASNGEINKARLPWESNRETAIRPAWQTDESVGQALIKSPDFGDASKMSCGKSAALPAPEVISIAAGDEITLYWCGPTDELISYVNPPPGVQMPLGDATGHFKPYTHAIGVVGDYLASCDGDCTTADVTNAGWTKVQESTFDPDTVMDQELRDLMVKRGEKHPAAGQPGLWALAKFQQDGSAWTLKVPQNLKPGQYIWRNELVAMHFDQPQLFIACTQLEVTGSGTATLPAGTKSSELYEPDGVFNEFIISPENSATFKYPGPALWSAEGSSNTSASAFKSSVSDVVGEKTATSPTGNTLPVEDAPIEEATDIEEEETPTTSIRSKPAATDLTTEDYEPTVSIQTSAGSSRVTRRPHWHHWKNFRGHRSNDD